MIKKFFSNFDKKRFIFVSEIIFIFIAACIVINMFDDTYTRYESNVDLNANANVAFFVIDQGTYESSISLNGLTPSLEPKYYTFYVANYKDNKRTNVDLEYTIKFETTTNLPLSYEIIRNESFSGAHTNLMQNTSVRQDDDGVFYKVFTNNNTYNFSHLQNQVDEYTLKIVFPESYKDYPDLYQGVVELFSIIIDASQVA